jgi:uncharacterized protein YeeX (DUF496 family)
MAYATVFLVSTDRHVRDALRQNASRRSPKDGIQSILSAVDNNKHVVLLINQKDYVRCTIKNLDGEYKERQLSLNGADLSKT